MSVLLSSVLTTVTVWPHSERHGPWFPTGLQKRQIEAEDLYGLGLAVLERCKAVRLSLQSGFFSAEGA